MGLLRSLFRKIFYRTKLGGELDFKNSQGILIRPDGSWIIAAKDPPQKKPQSKPQPNSNPFAGIVSPTPVLGKDLNWSTEDEPLLDILNFPPDYFPHAKELYSKLEQCLELDIITSCCHKQTKNNIYILVIELPCSTDQTKNMKRFKQFIKAMEEMYEFKTIQQQRINSITCNDQSYMVVFEYDPKNDILKKLNGEKNEQQD